jgi:hypothetical protein
MRAQWRRPARKQCVAVSLQQFVAGATNVKASLPNSAVATISHPDRPKYNRKPRTIFPLLGETRRINRRPQAGYLP